MKIYHFRVLLDTSQDIFRDIEIAEDAYFSALHAMIVKAFSFSGNEMASFYISNEMWDKGEEIAMIDLMDDTDQLPLRSMDTTKLDDLLGNVGDKMLYVYDFLRMWIFFVELVSVKAADPEVTYPTVVLLVGIAPAEDSRENAGPMVVEFANDDMYNDEGDIDEDEHDIPDDMGEYR